MKTLDLTDWKLDDLDRIDSKDVLGIQIDMNYLRDSKIDEIRMSMWNTYNQNSQNHSNYLLTIILAIVAFVAGLTSLSEDIKIVAAISFASFSILLIIGGWLRLRSVYWCLASDYLLILTLRDIRRLFNDHNRTNKHYYSNMPPISAVLLFAVREQLIHNQRIWTWRKYFTKKLALKTAGIKRPIFQRKV